MRALVSATLATLFFALPAHADEAMHGSEVIVIHGHVPPKVLPKPVHYNKNRVAPYSSKAILEDAWTRAWLLLDIDAKGNVTRFKFLNHPGYDLDPIATKEAFALQFAPARDARGNAIDTQVIWKIEWPAHGWLMTFNEQATGLPPEHGFGVPMSEYVPCRGDGPWNMGSVYPTYRDCSEPDTKAAATEAWINRRPGP